MAPWLPTSFAPAKAIMPLDNGIVMNAIFRCIMSSKAGQNLNMKVKAFESGITVTNGKALATINYQHTQ